MSMPWKSAVGFTLALVVASLALVLALASVQQKRRDVLVAPLDYSSLNADEINRQTLKAAAAIDRSRRGRTQGRRAELKVPLTKQVMETDAGQIALFEYRHGALPATLDEVATSTHESVKFSMRDAWNDKLKYVPHNNGHFQLVSAGPDKVFGTSDDIQETF